MTIQALQALGNLCPATDYGSAFSRALRLDFGNLQVVLISGTASIGAKGESLHPHNLPAQAWRAFENIEALLADADMSWQEVIWTTCYLRDMAYYRRFNEQRAAFYKSRDLATLPASVCVEAKLCRPDLLVEISAIAVKEI